MAAAMAFRPVWRIGWRERIGGGAYAPPGSLWVHGSSVGEILAASRLIDALRAKGHAVVASTWTATGREVMRRARPDVPVRLAPLDHPWCVASALRRVAPRAIVLIETELWPSWVAGATRRGIPVLVVSGRISDRSFPRYQRIGRWLRPTLQRIRAIGARTELDRERFVALGAVPERVTVCGDLKLELLPPPAVAPDLDAAIDAVPIVVAGSTHRGEESAALAGFEIARNAAPGAALVLAPRHPERVPEVVHAVRAAALPMRLRSALGGTPLAAGEVLVLDTLGELSGLFGRAAAAFVGGTLVPIGGHNLLEPVAARRPVVFGPNTSKVEPVADALIECGAGVRVTDAAGLGAAWADLLRDPSRASARGQAGFDAFEHHRGGAERAAELVLEAIGET